MSTFPTMEQIKNIAEVIKSKTSHQPKIGMILGSGLGSLANEIEIQMSQEH